jgi:hypothetical protein
MLSVRLFVGTTLVLVLAGCYSRFLAGPELRNAPKVVKVAIGKCSTPARLFDCRSVDRVGLFLQDYFKLNGTAPATKPGEGGILQVDVHEDQNVVALDLELRIPRGRVWLAQAQGGDVLIALVRFELLAQSHLGMKVKYATAENLAEPMDKLGRTRLVLDIKAGQVALEYK